MSFPLSARKSAAAEPDEPEPPRTLPDFLRDVRDAAEFATGIRSALADFPSALDTDTIRHTAQALFEIDVARRGSLKDHVAIQRLRQAERALDQRDQSIALTREKYEFSAAAAVLERLAEIKEIDADRTLARPEKIHAVRQRLFGAPPAHDDTPLFPDSSDETLDH